MAAIVCFQVPPTTQNVVGGQWLESSTDQWIDVHNPATNQVPDQIQLENQSDPTLMPPGGDEGSPVDPGRDGECSRIREGCRPILEQVFPDGEVPFIFIGAFDATFSRQQIMFKYQQLIKAHLDDIAKLITVEQVFYQERSSN